MRRPPCDVLIPEGKGSLAFFHGSFPAEDGPNYLQVPASSGFSGDSAGEQSVWGFPGDGNGNPLQYSSLGNPMDRGAWWAIVHGVAKSQTQLSDFHQLLFSPPSHFPLFLLMWITIQKAVIPLCQALVAHESWLNLHNHTLWDLWVSQSRLPPASAWELNCSIFRNPGRLLLNRAVPKNKMI